MEARPTPVFAFCVFSLWCAMLAIMLMRHG
jgi:hypothetical protein